MRVLVLAAAAALLSAWPAAAAGSQQTFQFPVGGNLYSPASIELGAGDTVCWSPQSSSFDNHPLVFDTGELADHTSGGGDYCPATGALPPGLYAFHCDVHGRTATVEGSPHRGMAGYFVVPGDGVAAPEFTVDLAGATATFTYTGTADPDDSIKQYQWDLDGNGSFETVTTEAAAQRTYTQNGTFHPLMRVVDTHHMPSATVTHDVVISGLPDPPPTGGEGGGGTPPPGGGGGGGTAPGADTTAPVVTLTLARRVRLAKRLALSFEASEPGSAAATLKAGKHRLASGKLTYTGAGDHRLTLRLSRKARRALRRAGKAKLTLVVADAAGNDLTLTRTVKLRRR